MVKRVVIVGNAPIAENLGQAIDGADIVVRFNEPSQTPEKIGERTDLLFVVNSGKSMQARLQNPEWLTSEFVRQAREIVLPYHPSVIAKYHPRPNLLSRLKGRRADWTYQTIEALGALGKPVTVLSASFYEESCRELGISGKELRRTFPSTGFLGIRYCLERYSGCRLEICGFGWAGWKRHNWEAERRWVAHRIQEGTIQQIAPML